MAIFRFKPKDLASLREHHSTIATLMFFGLTGQLAIYVYSWYLREIAPDIPILVGIPIFITMVYRVFVINMTYTEQEKKDLAVLYAKVPSIAEIIPTRTLSRRRILAENVFWYCVLFLAYLLLVFSFGFPRTFPERVSIFWAGELAYEAGASAFIILGVLAFSSVRQLYADIITIVHVIPRILSVFTVYFLIDLTFAIAYRSAFLVNGNAFSKPLDTFPTAFYFSTVTLSTLGYGDIYPQTDATRLLVCAETILGLIVLAAVLSVTISVGLSKPPSKTEVDNACQDKEC